MKLFYTDKNYLYVENDYLREIMIDDRLSFKSKGIFMEILSEHSNDIFAEYDFVTKKDKYSSVHEALLQLTKFKYIKKVKMFKGYTLYSNNFQDKENKSAGYVYCLADGYENYKIGKTRDLELRLKQYRTSMPCEPIIIKILKCTDMNKKEKELHFKFNSKII